MNIVKNRYAKRVLHFICKTAFLQS